MRIFLIGYMGAGKTTLGKAASRAMGLQFIDLDAYIESRTHRTVKQIFADDGEDGFRSIEQRMLHEVADFDDVLIAAGGGTPCFFDNMEYMNARGKTVFLEVSEDRLVSRLKAGKRKRPLLASKTDDELLAVIRQAMEKRLPFYSQAQLRFNADLLESRQQVNGSVRGLVELLRKEAK
jgi:shikimate kinase